MVEYRKPDQRSLDLIDRRNLQSAAIYRQSMLDAQEAQMKREIQAQLTAQLAKLRAMRLRGR